jgi:hypothetical protein
VAAAGGGLYFFPLAGHFVGSEFPPLFSDYFHCYFSSGESSQTGHLSGLFNVISTVGEGHLIAPRPPPEYCSAFPVLLIQIQPTGNISSDFSTSVVW